MPVHVNEEYVLAAGDTTPVTADVDRYSEVDAGAVPKLVGR